MTPRIKLLESLNEYLQIATEDREMVMQTIDFVKSNNDCFSRENLSGQVTGSVWLLNTDRTATLLTHHRKIGRWLQLGGHVDENENVFDAAYREAHEESGIEKINPVSLDIFDVDVHQIAAHKSVPAHTHYDVRYCMIAEGAPKISDESNDLCWIPLNSVQEYTDHSGILRMVEKSRHKI